MKLRVGLVGLGPAWEKRQRSALRSMSDRFEVRAVCEQVSARAAQVAKEFGASTVDGYRALARRADIDAIMVLSPEWFGVLPILAACDEGKAVYCGSAIDLTLDEAVSLKSRVEEAGIAFMVEFPRRLAPATLRLKELIATRLGRPRLLYCHQRRPAEVTSGPAANRHVDRASALARDLIEMLDWCRYIVGTRPCAVVGNGRIGAGYQGGYRMMSVDFEHPDGSGIGAMAQISSGRYMADQWIDANTFRPPAALQVSCEHGVAFVDLPSTLIWFDEAGRHVESLEADMPVGEQLFGQFHRAVTSLLRSTDDLDQAHLALRTVLGAEHSQRDGVRVKLT